MAHFLRRGTIGVVAGLIASIALIATLHNLLLGLVLGAAIGAVYSIMSPQFSTRCGDEAVS
jgi:hypothetical protein